MAALDFVFEENVDAARSLAADRFFLNSFHKPGRAHPGVLRVYGTRGDFVSIGRYHRTAGRSTTPPIWRRLSGGRALPFGRGFVGVSLVLPHRSALVSEEPFALAPYQVPNRYVRGILKALRALGIDAFYPGRDFITVNRRVIGMVTFETDEKGGLVFDAILALDRDFGILPGLLSTADPGGYLQGEILAPHAVTSVNAELEEDIEAGALADAVRRGFAEQFRIEVTARELSPLETRAIAAIESREFTDGWVSCRPVRKDLPLFAATPTSLGVFEVCFALAQDRFLREVQLSGDFIANAASVEALERELRLCPADWRSIALVADQVFNRPENYILGIGKLRTIPDTIVKALPQ
ncbi:MAG: hypothetical protein QOD06_662 [Candidatus Binatota bacterium]|nr:hypothetical protein [Candidatus Binatota bacterium]